MGRRSLVAIVLFVIATGCGPSSDGKQPKQEALTADAKLDAADRVLAVDASTAVSPVSTWVE